MNTEELLEKMELVYSAFNDIESLIKIVKDSCETNDFYNQEVVLGMACEKMDTAIEEFDELQSEMYRSSKQSQLQQFPEYS